MKAAFSRFILFTLLFVKASSLANRQVPQTTHTTSSSNEEAHSFGGYSYGESCLFGGSSQSVHVWTGRKNRKSDTKESPEGKGGFPSNTAFVPPGKK